LLHNTRGRRVYIACRSSLGSLELGFAVEGKTRDYTVLVIAETGKVCSDGKKEKFVARGMLKKTRQ